MNILILGSGGREHALTWKLAQSPLAGKILVAPGNAGTGLIAENRDISVTDFSAIRELVLAEQVQMVVVGPEDPLVKGIHDYFLDDPELADIPVIGPQKTGAALEGSKDFAKRFMMRHGIPTAAYSSFTADTLDQGKNFLGSLKPPYVLKADGLAAGKGVVILNDLDAAKKELSAMLVDSKFGSAGRTVVIEEFLDGIELSCFVLTDGEHYKILPMAKDYKRIGEGDTGLNTGGMGAVSPVPFADKAFETKIVQRIVEPTINGLKKDGIPYVGFIFIGLIKVGDDPFVIEYNVRMGDPETEVVIPRIKNDLVEVFQAVAAKKLHTLDILPDERAAVTIMLVSGGYPEAYKKGNVITGLAHSGASILFHAGTRSDSGKVTTNGGRVLAVTSYGKDFRQALKTSYTSIRDIHFNGMYYRSDIGFDL